MTNVAMENHHFFMVKSTISMAMFNSYVKLPEGSYRGILTKGVGIFGSLTYNQYQLSAGCPTKYGFVDNSNKDKDEKTGFQQLGMSQNRGSTAVH